MSVKGKYHLTERKWKRSMDIAIFGAQGYALGAYEALKVLYPKRNILCFLVSETGINASMLDRIPVKEVRTFSSELTREEKWNTEILIATPETVQPEIEELLEHYGLCHYQRLNYARWSELMKLFHARVGRFLPLQALPVGCQAPFVRIFMARSHKDRPLAYPPALPEYFLPLQAGAANTSERIASLLDNTGEQISSKNGNYSELTGLYWVWKNRLTAEGENLKSQTKHENAGRQYYGFCQYRRAFDFTGDDLLRLADNEVDAVLPYPLPYDPDVSAHHERYLKPSDWAAMVQALNELQPEYAETLPGVLGQRYLYNYNVILAKKEVLREYCKWLFPILERTEELSVPRGRERCDRYIGYLAETLETLYFMKHSDSLNIVHTVCRQFV